MLIIDVVLIISNEARVWDLLSFDVLSAFRITLTLGSFTVLGAFFPTLLESIFLILVLSAYITTMFLVHTYKSYFASFNIAVIYTRFVFTCINFMTCFCFLFRFIKYSHVSEIASSILDKSIHEKAKTKLKKRLEMMKLKSLEKQDIDPKRLRWPIGWKWTNVIFIITMMVDGALWSFFIPDRLFPVYLVTELCDIIFTILLLINDTQVEPTLIIELLRYIEFNENNVDV